MRFTFPLAVTLLLVSATAADADELRPYLRAGIGAAQSGGATFLDEDCATTSPAPLYGCGDGYDGRPYGSYGDFGSSMVFEAALGIELTPYLRLEGELSYRPGFAFEGQVNYPSSGTDQPVTGDVNQMGAMAFTYLAPLAALGSDAPLQPFIGGGLGLSHNEIGEMRMEFPALAQPRYSVTPDGGRTDVAWAVTAGLSYDVSDALSLDLAWRYSDFGKVETESGNLFIQRHNGTRDIAIGATEADFTAQSVSLSARWRF